MGLSLNTPQSEFLHNWQDIPGRRHSGLLHCQAGGGSRRFYAYDAQGNVSALAGSNGGLIGSGCYSPFGGAELASQLQQSGFGYKGQSGAYEDSEVGPMIMMVGGGQAYAPSAPTYTFQEHLLEV